MNLVRCEKGHYYDGDKFSSCPHCQEGGDQEEGLTVAMSSGLGEAGVTVAADTVQESGTVTPTMSLKDAVNLTETISTMDDDQKTVRLTPQSVSGTEPVVGWLVGLNGEVYGESFELRSGKNFIGRSASMDVSLHGDNAISRDKHAILIYEPKARIFIAQPGESRELFYLNDEVVLNNQKLKKNDVLCLGNTKLMFVPFCDENFCWEEKKKENEDE